MKFILTGLVVFVAFGLVLSGTLHIGMSLINTARNLLSRRKAAS